MDLAQKYPPQHLGPDTPSKDSLIKLLQAAVQLELTTVPLYMNAMYSMHPGTNDEAYHLIRSVVLEEMLHMTLAGNLMNALGRHPVLNKVGTANDSVPLFPAQMPYARHPVPLALQPFSEKAIDTFILIESPPKPPPGWKTYKTCDTLPFLKETRTTGWNTIGEFYAAIEEKLEALVATYGEREVFTGDKTWQIGPEDFYNSGGEAFEVVDLASARKAMRVIAEQGEGLRATLFTSDDVLFGEQRQVAHFFRFLEVRCKRRYGPNDTADDLPGGTSLDIDYTARYDTKTADTREQAQADRKALPAPQRALVEDFDRTYARLLVLLHDAFNRTPKRMKDAIPVMLDLRYKAEEIFRNPLPGHPGKHLHPTYEVTTTVLDDLSRELLLTPPPRPTTLPLGTVPVTSGSCVPKTLCMWQKPNRQGVGYGVGAGYDLDLAQLPVNEDNTMRKNVSSWHNGTDGDAELVAENGSIRTLPAGMSLEEPTEHDKTVVKIRWKRT